MYIFLYYAKCGSSFDTLPLDTVYTCACTPSLLLLSFFLSNETKQLENIKKELYSFLIIIFTIDVSVFTHFILIQIWSLETVHIRKYQVLVVLVSRFIMPLRSAIYRWNIVTDAGMWYSPVSIVICFSGKTFSLKLL